MSSSYSTNLRVELIGSGDQAGTWGSTTDSNFAYIFDVAIAGYQTVSVTSANQALTYLNGPTTTAALNQSVYAMLRFTTTTTAAFNVYAPPVSKQYVVYNNSGYSMTIYNSTVIGNTTAAGTGVTVTNGNKVMVWSDGTNFYGVDFAGIVPIANGGTGQTTANAAFNALAPAQTANRLLRSDGTNTSFAQAVLTTDVTGTLPIANGGTNSTSTPTAGGAVYGTGSAMAITAAGTSGQVLTSNGASAPSWVTPVTFASGTLMLFQQTAAPTGWTKQTTHDNKALRVVSGAASSGGSTAFTTVFTNQTPTITTSGLSASATTLSESQMPSHTHAGFVTAFGSVQRVSGNLDLSSVTGGVTAATGGGGSHTHSISGSATSSAITLNVQYVDLIIASKD